MSSFVGGTYDASFDGVDCMELFEQGGYGAAGPAAPVSYTIHNIPSSNDQVVIIMGTYAQPFEIAIGGDDDTIAALIAKKGTSGTLSYSRGSVTAILLDVRDDRKAGALDGYKATLQFL